VTATPIESIGGETGSPAVTLPPTNTPNDSGNGSTPLFALMICLVFGSLGLLAVQAQRKAVRR
jgi:hypothetical protein